MARPRAPSPTLVLIPALSPPSPPSDPSPSPSPSPAPPPLVDVGPSTVSVFVSVSTSVELTVVPPVPMAVEEEFTGPKGGTVEAPTVEELVSEKNKDVSDVSRSVELEGKGVGNSMVSVSVMRESELVGISGPVNWARAAGAMTAAAERTVVKRMMTEVVQLMCVVLSGTFWRVPARNLVGDRLMYR